MDTNILKDSRYLLPCNECVKLVLKCRDRRSSEAALRLELSEDHVPRLHDLTMGFRPWFLLSSEASEVFEVLRRELDPARVIRR